MGVEFSSYLCRVAEQNLASARLFRRQCPSVEIVCADAVHYPIPEEPTVFFFANPFKYEVMEVVLGNVVRSYLEIAAADISDILCNLVDNAADQ